MKLFNDLQLKFKQANWASNPEFALLDTVLEQHPEIIELLEVDISKGCKRSQFGRKDIPTVEQIIRAAIYKELKKLDYRELYFERLKFLLYF